MGISRFIITDNNISADKRYELKSTASYYYKIAEEYRNNFNYKEAVINYLNVILIERQYLPAYTGIALAYKEMKQYKKAVKYLKKGETIAPTDTYIQKELAICNIIEGEFDDGLKHLIKAISLEPKNPDLQMQLALVHEMIDEEDMALMIYKKITETNPNYIRAYIQMATLYMHLDDYISSAVIFKKISKIKPDYYRAFLALGICYEKLSNIKTAKRYYKKYLEKNPMANDYFDIKNRMKEISVPFVANKCKLKIIHT